MRSKKILYDNIALGKTRQVINSLLILTTLDQHQHSKAMDLAHQYKQYLEKKKSRVVSSHDLKEMLKAIHTMALALIDALPPENDPPTKMRKWKVALWGGILTTLGTLVTITGYSFKDIFSKKEDKIVVINPSQTVDTPSVLDTLAKFDPKINQEDHFERDVNISVTENGKVGSIINGDSNHIYLNQNF